MIACIIAIKNVHVGPQDGCPAGSGKTENFWISRKITDAFWQKRCCFRSLADSGKSQLSANPWGANSAAL